MWEKLRDNLAGIAAAALFAWIAGYAQGTNETATMKSRVDQLERQLGDTKKIADGRRLFGSEATNRIEFLCNRDPECRQRFQPLQVPE